MTSIGLPVPLVLLLRRLFNAFSAFSISQSCLISLWSANAKAGNVASEVDADLENGEQPAETQEDPRLSASPRSSWEALKSLSQIPWRKRLPSDSLFESLWNKGDIARLRLLHTNAHGDGPRSTSTATDRDTIHQLINYPTLFDPVRAPRNPIVLCHGLYGFDVRGPETFPKLRMHYWSNVLNILQKKVGAEVVVTGVPGTGSVASRAERMDRFLRERVKGRDINFMAHSMGGLDCRHLITHIDPQDYKPLSLTSLSVPHRGSPFMDWCLANIGIGSPRPFPFPSTTSSQPSPSQEEPSTPPNSLPYSLKSPLLTHPSGRVDGVQSPSFTLNMLPSNFFSLVLSLIDSPAYSNLTTSFLRNKFNPRTPNKPGVRYFSVAARTTKMSIWHPLWLPKLITDAAEEQETLDLQQKATQYQSDVTVSYADMNAEEQRDPQRGNDGLVTVSSAKWGEHLGTLEGCDHWEMRGARGFGVEWDEGWAKSWREWVSTWTQSERNNVEGNEPSSPTRVKVKGGSTDWATKNELTSRFDLERFYVALSRKLYNEGL